MPYMNIEKTTFRTAPIPLDNSAAYKRLLPATVLKSVIAYYMYKYYLYI